jgi:hypothetical protein
MKKVEDAACLMSRPSAGTGAYRCERRSKTSTRRALLASSLLRSSP